MSSHTRRLIKTELDAAVMAQQLDIANNQTWYTILAAGLGGVFYFFALFFGHNWWLVLAGD